jgi:hypothetical protein
VVAVKEPILPSAVAGLLGQIILVAVVRHTKAILQLDLVAMVDLVSSS